MKNEKCNLSDIALCAMAVSVLGLLGTAAILTARAAKKPKNNAISARGGDVAGIEKQKIARNNARGVVKLAATGIKNSENA